MRKLYLVLFALLIGVSVIACGGSSGGGSDSSGSSNELPIVTGNYTLSFKTSGVCYLKVDSNNNISGIAEDVDGVYSVSGKVNNSKGTATLKNDGKTAYNLALNFTSSGVSGSWSGENNSKGTVSGIKSNVASNNQPVLLGTPKSGITAGSEYTFVPTAYDYDGDFLTFTINGKPSWATFDTKIGKLTGIPNLIDAGTYTNIVITVSDGKGGSSECKFSIVVSGTNSAPILPSGIKNEQVNINTLFENTITAYDPDQDIISYTLTQAPAWLTVNGITGKISGIPTTVGEHTVIYSASDGRGGNASITFKIIVKDPSASSRFVRDNVKNIVIDQTNNTMWQDDNPLKLVSELKNYTDSVAYCENLVLGGYSDWYLPSFEEMQTTQQSDGSIDPAFNSVQQYNYIAYWTTTNYSDQLNGVKTMLIYNSSKSSLGNVSFGNGYYRCARK